MLLLPLIVCLALQIATGQAHVMNDEAARKYITSIKRLIRRGLSTGLGLTTGIRARMYSASNTHATAFRLATELCSFAQTKYPSDPSKMIFS